MKKGWLVFIVLIFLTLIGLCIPYWVTQNPSNYNFGVTDANEIGDTIGGILGPYFSFIGSCLVAITIYLQLRTREDDRRKDFEKVIFDNCLETLKSGEAKIHEINGVFIENRLAIYVYIGNYFRKEDQAKALKIGFFLNDINNSIYLFNENKIKSKAYQLIILYEIEIIMRLTRYSLIGIWNNKKKRTSGFTSFFFNHPHIERFNLIKSFYSNIRDFKVRFRNEFEASFQKVEILQLEETCTWLESIEPDFLEYCEILFGEKEMAELETEVEGKANKIRAKYNLPAKTYGELLRF
jgi:hypothetical protein